LRKATLERHRQHSHAEHGNDANLVNTLNPLDFIRHNHRHRLKSSQINQQFNSYQQSHQFGAISNGNL
jgi:hypothetical protein